MNKDLTFYCGVNHNFEEKYEAYKELRSKVEKVIKISTDIANIGIKEMKLPAYIKDNLEIRMKLKILNNNFCGIFLKVELNEKIITSIEMNENFQLEKYLAKKNNIDIGKELISNYLDFVIEKLEDDHKIVKKEHEKLSRTKISKENLI
jgi:hypothetical protein